MKRRAFLGTAATAAFAGCGGVLGRVTDQSTTESPRTTTDDDSTGGSETTNGSGSTTDDRGAGVEHVLSRVHGPPLSVENAAVDVTVTRKFTDDHPASLAVAFTNEADEARTFQFGSLLPWDALRGPAVDGDGVLLLSPGAGVVPDSPDGGCWRATSGVALPMVVRTPTLDPGETVSRTFDVLAAHDSPSCLEPGTYRFSDANYLESGWWFEVELTGVVHHGRP
ncbi:MAG: hypothetical protein ABEJ88_01710 [Halobacterium sp.]